MNRTDRRLAIGPMRLEGAVWRQHGQRSFQNHADSSPFQVSTSAQEAGPVKFCLQIAIVMRNTLAGRCRRSLRSRVFMGKLSTSEWNRARRIQSRDPFGTGNILHRRFVWRRITRRKSQNPATFQPSADDEKRRGNWQTKGETVSVEKSVPDAERDQGAIIVSRWNLFTGFLLVGMFGFGGIAAALYHVVVDRRRWLTPTEYTSMLGLGQVLPGANLINLATMVGDRFQGALGACLALSGLMFMPVIILIVLASLYDHYADLPDVRAATIAAAAGAVGLTMGTGFKLARTILKSPIAIAFAAVSFSAIGLLRFPMVTTILVLAPMAVAAEFWRHRK